MREAVLVRTKLGFLAMAAQLGCSVPNPAYRPVVSRPDANAVNLVEADVPPVPLDAAPDAAVPLDLSALPDLAATALPGAAPDARPGGLVAHWRLDEPAGDDTALDEVGSNHGALENGASRSGGFPGGHFPNPGAVVFDGQDDHVELGFQGLPAMQAVKTVSVWCKVAPVSTTARRNVVVFNNRNARQSWQLGLERGFPAVWSWGPDPAPLISATPLDQQWHHLAYVYDGAFQRLYVDGIPVATMGGPPPGATVAGAHLGAYDPDQDQSERWSGMIDDVRIYGRALSADEVRWLAAGHD